MAISKIKTYRYQEPFPSASPTAFEVDTIQLDTSCSSNKSHRSECYKIIFIAEGSGNYQVDFQEFEVKKAGIFFLSPGQVFTVGSETMKTGYQISFNKEFYCVESHGKEIACNGVLFNNVHKAKHLALAEDDKVRFTVLIDSMIRELSNPGKAHQVMLETYLRLFLLEALRLHDNQIDISVAEQEEANGLVGDFIALVDKHFRTTHAIADYAEKLFISPKSLAKRLKAHHYGTPTEILRDRIMLEAKRDLRYTQKSVKEIAFDLGFEDPAYFTRYFKKSEKKSPQGYRVSFAAGA